MKNILYIKDIMMKTKAYIIASLVSVALFTACEKSELPDRTKVADGARICFFNLSADVTTTGTVMTNELNLYFNDARVTTQQSTVKNRLRGIPYRSSYPGVVTAAPAVATAPTSYPGGEYFIAEPGQTNIVAKDTALKAGQTTLFTTDFNFQKDKYYSIFAMDLRPAMAPVIVEDNIVPFNTLKKVKIRAVNGLYGVARAKVDIWIIHQPGTTSQAIPPYKLALGLDYKTVTAFSDTITAGSYKWTVTIAGAAPTITAPTAPTAGKPYTLSFTAANVLVAQASAGTTFAERTTYSFLVFGQFGKTGVIAPFGNLFRNRWL
ncbi:MAG: hypothetical protein WC854_11395 [Bacteroidales bacterium]